MKRSLINDYFNILMQIYVLINDIILFEFLNSFYKFLNFEIMRTEKHLPFLKLQMNHKREYK